MLVDDVYEYVVNGDDGAPTRPNQFNLIKTPGMPLNLLSQPGFSHSWMPGSRCNRGACNDNGLCEVSSDNVGDVVDFFTGLSAQGAGGSRV